MTDTREGTRPPELPRQVAKGGATTLVLALLADRPMYGYELVQAIRERSDGLLSFGEGTVYPILYALRDKGYLRSEAQESKEGRRRRVYHVTPLGLEALAAYRSEWDRLTEGMRLALDG
ncbi:MAG: PadR family transcriptional regulator [Gemmatimonadota bacterium]